MVGRLLLLAAGACLAAACTLHYPGEPVATFRITGSLEDNTCGAQAVPATDPVVFSAEVRRDGAEAWWRRPRAPVVAGSVLSDGTYRFRTSAAYTVIAPDPSKGQPGCVLSQNETIEAQITGLPEDAGMPDDGGSTEDGGVATGMAHLEGTHHIELTPTAGSACAPALASSGGPFLALPCAIDYTLAGDQTSGF